MIADALKVGKYIGEHKAGIYAAVSVLHTEYMSCTQLFLKLIHYLLKRLYTRGRLSVVLGKAHICEVHDLAYGCCQYAELLFCIGREYYILVFAFLGRLKYVETEIRNTLKISDKLKVL